MQFTQEEVQQAVIDWLETKPWNVGILGGYVDMWHGTERETEEWARWFTKAMFAVIKFAEDQESDNGMDDGVGGSGVVLPEGG